MMIPRSVVAVAQAVLRKLGLQLSRYRPAMKPWDESFSGWIAEAERRGLDPNDIGDQEWGDDPLAKALATHYLPYIRPDSLVLELGPGSGRLTRHLIGRCREMVLVDYSEFVCAWLSRYLEGKGKYRIYRLDGPLIPMVEDASIDLIVANGVFEHVELDDFYWFIQSFYRVAKVGAVVSFNFDNLMSRGGLEWLERFRGTPGTRSIFRFYHPELIQRLAEAAGFQCIALETSDSRFAHIDLRKGASLGAAHGSPLR